MAAMRSRMTVIFSVCALVAAVCSGASSAAAPAVDCSSLVLNMADCLTFVTAGSTAKKPEGACCSGLKTVLKTDAECLCEAFRNSAQLGVTLNITKAMTLPSACHVSAPSVSNCGLSTGVGAAAPASTGIGAAAPVSTGRGAAAPVTTGTGAAPALPPSAVSPSSVAEPPTTGTDASIGANEVSPAPAPGASASSASSCMASIGLLLVFAAASFTLF